MEGVSFIDGGASDSQLQALFGGAQNSTVDVTARLQESDVQRLLGASDPVLDQLLTRLTGVHVDHLMLDSGQVVELANAGYSLQGIDVVVTGTAFLANGGVDGLVADAPGSLEAKVEHLLASAPKVSVEVSDAILRSLVEDSSLAQSLFDRLADAGVDAVMTPSMGFNIDNGLNEFYLGDHLANALAEALGEVGMDLDSQSFSHIDKVAVIAEPDAEIGWAVLQASLHDLAKVGVDEVRAAQGTSKVVVALRDKNETSTTNLGFDPLSPADIPLFDKAPGGQVFLAVDDDDLRALNHLLDIDGQSGQQDWSEFFQLLHDKGFTDFGFTGTTESALFNKLVGLASAKAVTALPMTLDPVEVKLLGAELEPSDPFDPFNPHYKP